MFLIGNFNFTNYPDILDKYKKYTRLYNKFSKACDKNADNIDELEKILDEYACGEMAEAVYKAFAAKKPDLIVHYGKEKGFVKKWDEVFPTDFEGLNDEQRACLCGLIECHYNYLLPEEYYLEYTKFQEL